MTGLGPSRTVTRYDADSPKADIDVHTDETNPEILERDGADASAGHDTFVAHQWGRKETPAKRIRTPRHNTNDITVCGRHSGGWIRPGRS